MHVFFKIICHKINWIIIMHTRNHLVKHINILNLIIFYNLFSIHEFLIISKPIKF